MSYESRRRRHQREVRPVLRALGSQLVASLNDYEVKLVEVQGEFVWHTHEDTDEFFPVVDGHPTIQLRDRDVVLGPGQLFVVPRGVEHCPRAEDEVKALLLEPTGVVKTGTPAAPSRPSLRRSDSLSCRG